MQSPPDGSESSGHECEEEYESEYSREEAVNQVSGPVADSSAQLREKEPAVQ